MVAYAFKRVVRSWKLFIALLLGVILASSFFAGMNISVNSMGVKALKQQLEQVYGDFLVSSSGTPVLSPQNATALQNLIISNIEGVKGVDIISKTGMDWTDLTSGTTPNPALLLKVKFPDGSNMTLRFVVDNVIGVTEGSYVYQHLVLESGKWLGENETFIESESEIASKLNIGDKINVSIPVILGLGTTAKTYYVERTLIVAGFVTMDDQSYLMGLGMYTVSTFTPLAPSTARRASHNLIIVDWNKTFTGILDEVYNYVPTSSPVVTRLIVNLDRDTLVNPWDVETSRMNLDRVASRITNLIQVNFGAKRFNPTNNLVSAINFYGTISTLMILQGIILSLPVFFVAWYVGLTVSDVSYHLRRREIGLLLTKGFTNRQLLQLFLMEATFIGAIGAAAGLTLGIAFTPLFTMGQLSELPVVNIDTIIAVVVFSVVIALLAAFQPARKAANLRPIETIREYFSVEEVKPYRKIWVLLALALGTYKIAMLILGLDLGTLLPAAGALRGGGGLLMYIFRQVAVFVDNILLYLGPILFFWGFTKIFVSGSLRFQNALARVTNPFVKDLSLLAERNIQRNAARVASTTFLLAIIVGYAVSAVGMVASQNDYTTRLVYQNVGADINVQPDSLGNITLIRNELMVNITGVLNSAVEYRGFSGRTVLGTDSSSTQLVAINPEEWLSSAKYEEEWFTGGESAEQVIRALSNETIILDGRFSDYLKVGDNVSITIGGKTFNLKVLGFFGSSSQSLSGLTQAQQTVARLSLNSYVSDSLYSQVNRSVMATARVLVKLQPGENGESRANEIKNLPGVNWVTSAAEQIGLREENVLLSGSLNISKLGVLFAALAASIGVALVTVVTLQERRKEITLLMVRGLSVKQVILILLTENLSTLLIAGLMGGFVGYLIDRGNIASSRSASLLVTARVIFPLDAVTNVLAIFVLLVVSTVLPVILMVIAKSSKLVWRT